MKARIPLVGQPNQRNLDSLQALIEGKDQRYQNGLIIPVNNPLSGTVKHYFEKRPGLEENCPAAHGDRGFNIFYSRTTGKTLAFFVDAEDIHTPYVDCVDVGPFDLQVTPVDRGDGRFFAIEDLAAGTPHAYTSVNNGETWSEQTVSDNTVSWQNIAWDGTNFCVVGDADSCMTSPDGINWTTRTMPSPHSGSVVYGGVRRLKTGVFGAVAPSISGLQNTLSISTDHGVNWTRLNGVGVLNARQAAYSEALGIYVVCGGSSPGMRYSDDDGSTWADASIPVSGYQDVVWVPWLDLFVGGVNGLGAATIYSSDGVNWTRKVNGSDAGAGEVLNVAYSDDLIVSVNGSNNVYVSEDGISWTAHAVGGSQGFTRIAWNGAVFCITTYATNGEVATSSDGVNWTRYDNSTNEIGFNIVGIAARWIDLD